MPVLAHWQRLPAASNAAARVRCLTQWRPAAGRRVFQSYPVVSTNCRPHATRWLACIPIPDPFPARNAAVTACRWPGLRGRTAPRAACRDRYLCCLCRAFAPVPAPPTDEPITASASGMVSLTRPGGSPAGDSSGPGIMAMAAGTPWRQQRSNAQHACRHRLNGRQGSGRP